MNAARVRKGAGVVEVALVVEPLQIVLRVQPIDRATRDRRKALGLGNRFHVFLRLYGVGSVADVGSGRRGIRQTWDPADVGSGFSRIASVGSGFSRIAFCLVSR